MRCLIWGIDYFVYYVPLPYNVGGGSALNPDGTYTIYVNSRHYATQQWAAFKHELVHCEAGHLDERKWLTNEQKEWEADHLHPLVNIPPDGGQVIYISRQELENMGIAV